MRQGMTGFFKSICLSGLMLGATVFASATVLAKPLSKSEQQVCRSVRMCMDIVERHTPSEFDYAVLAGEFRRFGIRGIDAVLAMKDASRAQVILSGDAMWPLPPKAQAELVKRYPQGDAELHAAILMRIDTSAARNAVIAGLDHPEATVRAASRGAAPQLVTRHVDVPLSGHARAQLAKATLDTPTPALVSALATVPNAQTTAVLTRLLGSGDGAVVTSAYTALYAQNPKLAFEALLTHLRNLEGESDANMMALARTLVTRHADRKDGFYMRFANDLSRDAKMSVGGNAVGLAAVILAPAGLPPADIGKSPVQRKALVRLVSQTDPELSRALGAALPRLHADARVDLIQAFEAAPAARIGQVELAALARWNGSDALILKSLSHPDYRVQITAIGAAAQRKIPQARPVLDSLSRTHPFVPVRDAARQAMGVSVTRDRDMCRLPPLAPPAALADQMPFFEGAGPDQFDLRRRVDLKTAFPTVSGWMTGYQGRSGAGLIYYPNALGLSPIVLSETIVTAIHPVSPVAPGRGAAELWVVSQGEVLRVRVRDNAPEIISTRRLPAPVQGFSQAGNDAVLNFVADRAGYVHPALRLTPKGIVRFCETVPKSSPRTGTLP